MPSPSRCLTAGDAHAFVRDQAVHEQTSSPRVGLELEVHTFPVGDRSRRVDLAPLASLVRALDGALPCRSRVTIEPGGQVEISTLPCHSVGDAIDATRSDLRALTSALVDIGIATEASGFDRVRPPVRLVDAPRYRAMETYFDSSGPEGRLMMCNSASMQINVDIDGDIRDAWRAAQLVADRLGREFSQPCPNRRELWASIDPSRTAPVGGRDPREAWARYALGARVMFIRIDDDECLPVLDGLTFCEWIEHGHAAGWPTEADLAEHLTTLFPPVRPRGFLELRTIDALDDATWPVAATRAVELLVDGAPRRALLENECR